MVNQLQNLSVKSNGKDPVVPLQSTMNDVNKFSEVNFAITNRTVTVNLIIGDDLKLAKVEKDHESRQAYFGNKTTDQDDNSKHELFLPPFPSNSILER